MSTQESVSGNKRNFAEYLILNDMVKSIMKKENMTDDALQHMDNKTVDKVRQSSLHLQ